MREDGLPLHYRIVDPTTGDTIGEGDRESGQPVLHDCRQPRVIIFCDEQPAAGRQPAG